MPVLSRNFLRKEMRTNWNTFLTRAIILFQVDDIKCGGHKPWLEETCNQMDCPKWSATEWSTVCINIMFYYVCFFSQNFWNKSVLFTSGGKIWDNGMEVFVLLLLLMELITCFIQGRIQSKKVGIHTLTPKRFLLRWLIIIIKFILMWLRVHQFKLKMVFMAIIKRTIIFF